MRTRPIAFVAVAALLALTGCNGDEPPTALPPVRVVDQPAASAGGTCILWDYALLERELGVAFTVAASDQVDNTFTCVVQTEDGDAPYLSLSVVESTKADATTFSELAPAKAKKIKGLGKAGYRLTGKPTKGYGPSVEIGWLSEAKQVQTLRFTFAEGAPDDAVADMTTRLTRLAKALNTTAG